MRAPFVLATVLVAAAVVISCKKTPTQPNSDVFSVAQSGTTPATAAAGTSVSVAFLVKRGAVPASGQTVTLTVTAGGGTVGGGTSSTATTGSDGIASATWVLGTAVGPQTIRGSIASGGSADVSVNATQPPATALVVTTAPGNAVTGVPLNPQPVVQLKDANGNNVPLANVAVTVAIQTGGGTLTGTTTVNTNATGTATFTNLVITGTAGNRVLHFTATAAGNALAVSTGNILLAQPQLTIATAPTAAPRTGIPFFVQPVLQLNDGNGNNIAQAGVVVTVAISSGNGVLGVPSASGSAALHGPGTTASSASLTATTDATGMAKFADLAITGGGDNTLMFSAPGFTSVTTGTLAVNPSAGLTTLLNGIESSRLSGPAGTLFYFTTVIPAGSTDLSFLLYGGTGTVRMYARRGAYPTSTAFDCSSVLPVPTQRCDIAANRDGTWFVVLEAGTVFADELYRALAYGPACAQTPLPINTVVAGTLINGSDCNVPFRGTTGSYDRYLFNSATTQAVNFAVTSSNFVALSVKPTNQARGYYSFGATGGTTTVPTLLPAGNTSIEVYDFTFAQAGGQSYTLKVIPASADLAACGFLFAPWGGSITLNLASTDCAGTTSGTRSDRITVGVQSNQTLTVTMSSTAFDPYLRLFNTQTLGAGTVVAQDDNSGGGTTARITYTNPSLDVQSSVDYTIEATTLIPGGLGAYTLTLTIGPDHYSAPPALTPALRSGWSLFPLAPAAPRPQR